MAAAAAKILSDRVVRTIPLRLLPVRIDKAIDDDLPENIADLPLVAAHEDGVLQRVLRHLAQLIEVLLQNLDLFEAGDRLAFGRAPDAGGIAGGHGAVPNAAVTAAATMGSGLLLAGRR
jgi:hypothetical protein